VSRSSRASRRHRSFYVDPHLQCAHARAAREGKASEAHERTPAVGTQGRALLATSKFDNGAAWASGTGLILKNGGPFAFSTSSISRQSVECHDVISVPMATQSVRLPQLPALALLRATELAESLTSPSLVQFGLQRHSRRRRSAEAALLLKPERASNP